MGLLNWLFSRRASRSEATLPPKCAFCSEPVSAKLVEFDLEGPPDCFLLQCPECGQYWGGHGYTRHFRWQLTPEEAASHFPGLKQATPNPFSVPQK
jgi:hypothetical protein